jgi:hypothetical protein
MGDTSRKDQNINPSDINVLLGGLQTGAFRAPEAVPPLPGAPNSDRKERHDDTHQVGGDTGRKRERRVTGGARRRQGLG